MELRVTLLHNVTRTRETTCRGPVEPADNPLSGVMAHVSVLSVIWAMLSWNKKVHVLVDTGFSAVVVRSSLVDHSEGTSCMSVFNGREVKCLGVSLLELEVAGITVWVHAVINDSLVDGVDIILGMDVINQLGGVTVRWSKVQFGVVQCSVAIGLLLVSGDNKGHEMCSIEDKDFKASFDGTVGFFFFSCKPLG